MTAILLDYINTLHYQYTKVLLDNIDVCVCVLKKYIEENPGDSRLECSIMKAIYKIDALYKQNPYKRNQLILDYLLFVKNRILVKLQFAIMFDKGLEDLEYPADNSVTGEDILYLIENFNKNFESSFSFVGNILMEDSNKSLDAYYTKLSDSALTITNNINDFICINKDGKLRLFHLVPNEENKRLQVSTDDQGNRVVRIITETFDDSYEGPMIYNIIIDKTQDDIEVVSCGSGPVIVKQCDDNGNLVFCMALKGLDKNEYDEDVMSITSSDFPPLPGIIKAISNTNTVKFGANN